MASSNLSLGRRIGLIVDHPRRDLPGIVLLAHALARRGAAAVIVPMYEQGVDVPRLGLNAVVANYVRASNAELIARFARAGLAVYVLDTEGAGTAEGGGNSPSEMAAQLCANGSAEPLTGYLFWGRIMRDALAGQNVLSADRLHLTGCPRFDFAAPRWRGLLQPARTGYVLVNANFPLVNPRFTRKLDQEKGNMVSAGWDRAYVERYFTALVTVFERFLAQVRSLALVRPQCQLLVRPHPFESVEPYRRMAEGCANVVVDGTGDVLSVIAGCDAVLHVNCATAIEAVMLGKLPIHMEHLDTPVTARHAGMPARASRAVKNEEELLAVIDALPQETAAFDFAGVHRRVIEPHFHLNDGGASDRVADVLLSRPPARPGWVSLRDVACGSRPRASLGQRAKGMISLLAGSAAAERLRTVLEPTRDVKRIDPVVVSALLANLSRHSGLDPDGIVAARARCRVSGVPLSSLVVSPA